MRGQAFVIFKKPEDAEAAKNTLQNFNFFSKPIRIEYAKNEGYAASIDKGQFIFKEYKNRMYADDEKTDKQQENEEQVSDKEMEEEIDENENWTNILLVENFPEANRAEKFQYMFETKKGCVSVKYIEEKNIGIVEFERNKDAKAVLDELNGFKMTDTHILKISYMKRIGE